MQINDILRVKGAEVATVSPEETVATVVARLAELGIGALVVSGDGSDVVGIISERDIVRALPAHGADLLALQVREIMTSEVYTCEVETNMVELATQMTTRRFRHVPVLDEGRLVGIVSIGDVVKRRIDQLASERDQLEAYIHG